MKCPSCGVELNEGSSICPNCGTNLVASQTEQINTNEVQNNNQLPNDEKQTIIYYKENDKNSRNLFIVSIISGIIIIALIIVIILLLSKGNGNDPLNDLDDFDTNDIVNNDNSNTSKGNSIKDKGKNTPSKKVPFNDDNREEYASVILSYVDYVRREVNAAVNYQFFDENALYLVSVANSCIALDEEYYNVYSPFSKEWKYNFIAVKYYGSGFKYYSLALDGENYGTEMIDMQTLINDSDYIVESEEVSKYVELYNLKDVEVFYEEDMDYTLRSLMEQFPDVDKIYVYGCNK